MPIEVSAYNHSFTWHIIHVDYAGYFDRSMILIIIDAHSKYIDAHIVSAATTRATFTKLRQKCAMFGLRSSVVSDNGTCFCRDEFQQFYRASGIKHIKYSPCHPASNGLAERAVQTVKVGLKKTRGNLEGRLNIFLARHTVTLQMSWQETVSDRNGSQR